MKSRISVFLFIFKYLFLAERSLNPGLDAPVIARIRDRFVFLGKIKAVLWIGIGILLTFMMAGLH